MCSGSNNILIIYIFQTQRPELIEIADRTRADGDAGIQSDSSSSGSSSSSSSYSSDSDSYDSERTCSNKNNNYVKKRQGLLVSLPPQFMLES